MEMTALMISRWLKASTMPIRESSTRLTPPIAPSRRPGIFSAGAEFIWIGSFPAGLLRYAFLTASRSPRMPVGRKIRTSTSMVKAMASLS